MNKNESSKEETEIDDGHQQMAELLKDLGEFISNDEDGKDYVTIGNLLKYMHSYGFCLSIMILSLPSLFPGLLPPLPSILAIPIVFCSVQMIMSRKDVYIVPFIANIKLKRRHIHKVITKFDQVLKKNLSKTSPTNRFELTLESEKRLGIVFLLFGLTVFIPLPLTNFFPSAGMVVACLGAFLQNRLYVIIGIIVGLFGVALALSAVYTLLLFV